MLILQTCFGRSRPQCKSDKDENASFIYVNLPYLGTKQEQLVKSCLHKFRKCFKKEKMVHFKVLYNTNKISYYTNTKDRTPLLIRSSVVYEFKCPGCKANYIGKTNRISFERTLEHGWPNSLSTTR